MMDEAVSSLKASCVKVYIDDVFVHTDGISIEEAMAKRITDLENVFEIADAANLRFQLSKCCLIRGRVRHLGHMLDADGRSVDPWYVEDVSRYKRPTTKEEVQRFTGLVCLYCLYEGSKIIFSEIHADCT